MAAQMSADNTPSISTTPHQTKSVMWSPQASVVNYPNTLDSQTPHEVKDFMWGTSMAPGVVVIPSGALRIGGDAPSGLVLVGTAPASRTVDLFDRETKVLVASTVSGIDGTYAFTGLSDRPEGYDYVIRGNLGAGEKDYIGCGVHPG